MADKETNPVHLPTEREREVLLDKAKRPPEGPDERRRDADKSKGDAQCQELFAVDKDTKLFCRFVAAHAGQHKTYADHEWETRS